VRNATIVALGELQDQEAFLLLVECLHAPTTPERQNAVQALVVLGNPQMQMPVLHTLSGEPHAAVRIAIIQALSAYRTNQSIIDGVIDRLSME
jgi:HEAT repeat protein